MKDLFTAEDFNCVVIEVAELIAEIANEKLRKEAAKWPVVYGKEEEGVFYSFSTVPSGPLTKQIDTHVARLAFIEEIVKEPCKHKPVTYASQGLGEVDMTLVKCAYCGVELKAEWKAVE